MREILLNGEWTSEWPIKRSLGIEKTKFPYSTLFPGAPNEITNLLLGSGEKLILLLSGAGFVLAADCKKASAYFGQPTIYRMISGREEGVFIPKGFAVGYLFKGINSLFLEIDSENEEKTTFSPYKFKINFLGSCGVSEHSLKTYEVKKLLDNGGKTP